MEFLNLIVQFSTLTFLALIIILNIRDGCCLTQRLIMIGLGFSIGGYVISFGSEAMQLSDEVRRAALLVHVPSMALVWLFGLMLFDDEFEFRRSHAALSLLYIIPAFYICWVFPDSLFEEITAAHIMLSFYGLMLMAHLIYKLASGYKDDLIGSRRRARLLFVGALIIVSSVMSLAEINMVPLRADILEWFKIGSMFIMSLWVLLWIMRLDVDALNFSPLPASKRSIIALTDVAVLNDPRDEALKQNLINLMESEQAYMQQGLTIRELADKVGAPEHRLRHIINKGLGYRNFSAFLNSYRITAIKTALKDPKKSRLPILTLAMDYGYNSLAPFNRAFRESEGMTPSEYRHALNS